jgi:hypothetical protein
VVAYTLLQVTEGGIVLRQYHLRRLGLAVSAPGPGGAPEAAMASFARFAAGAAPGAWAVWREGDAVRAERRPGTRLFDGMRARLATSPIAGSEGPIPKPAPPSIYDGVRRPGVATLLTSVDGAEIYEACVAAVLGWDGERVVCVPRDRPRVLSTAEAAVRDHLPVVEAPIEARSRMPVLLVNALKGACAVDLPGREAFPVRARGEVERLFRSLTG